MSIRVFSKEEENKKRGFTLLFAVLVSTLVVAIGATVISIALRQTILSGTSRESQYAFYAANTVLECAFYWDVIGGSNPEDGPVFPAEGEIARSSFSNVKCAGGNLEDGSGFVTTFANGGWDRNGEETTFRIEISDQGTSGYSHRYCAQATVSKTTDDSTGIVTTVIEAKGYNTCDLTSARAVERGLIQSYES